MLKLILKQLWNRKKSNTWMAVELLIVFCISWYIADFFFVLAHNCSIPNYRDLNHAWYINIRQLPEDNAQYMPEESEPEILIENYQRVLRTIKDYAEVEALAISYRGSAPGRGDFWGSGLINHEDTTKFVSGQYIVIDPDEDFFKVFGYTSEAGKKPVSARDFDWSNPKGMVIGKITEERLFAGESAIGKIVRMNGSNRKDYYPIIGVVDDTKRFDYELPQVTIYGSQRIAVSNIKDAEIAIRSSASVNDAIFKEAFMKDMSKKLRVGNFYLQSMIPYKKINADTDFSFGLTNDIRIRTYMMAFFLLNILLCVMGTFWYRINTRREEIGTRMAMGSSRSGVRNMLILEGLCLLSIVVIPAMIIEYQFVRADLIPTFYSGTNNNTEGYLTGRIFLRFLITNGITWLIMSLVVIAAIWFPARKAAAMMPAEALHYE